jgi:hypothetical protein
MPEIARDRWSTDVKQKNGGALEAPPFFIPAAIRGRP